MKQRNSLLWALTACILFLTNVETIHAAVKGLTKGNAFGSWGFQQAGDLSAKFGESAYIVCPCEGTKGNVRSNTLASLDAGPALKTQQIYNTVYTKKTSALTTVRNTSKVQGLKLLGRLITADAVFAVANTNADSTNIRSNDKGSTFTNLRINGSSFGATFAPNTRMNLSGFGYVILRETIRSGNKTSSGQITVNMLHIFITVPNSLNLPVGAEIIVAHATSGFVRTVADIKFAANAWVADAISTSSSISSRLGHVAPVYIGCEGSGGQTRTNNINSLAVSNILSSGSGTTTGKTTLSSSISSAMTSATVQNLNLVNGIITADTVKAVSLSRYGSGQGSTSNDGSGFVNLKVLGIPVSSNVAPGTRIDLPGLGYVKLFDVSKSADSSGAQNRVNMIQLFITQSNAFGLPVGTRIFVSIATSSVKPF